MKSPYIPVSSYLGKVERMVLAIGGNITLPIKDVIDRCANIISAFDKEVQFFIIARYMSSNKDSEFKSEEEFIHLVTTEFESRGIKNIQNIVPLDFDLEVNWFIGKFKEILQVGESCTSIKTADEYRKWVQDSFLVLNTRSKDVVLLDPLYWENQTLGDTFLADFISSKTNAVLKSFPFYLRGGNVLVGDDFAFVGADDLVLNTNAFGKDWGVGKVKDRFTNALHYLLGPEKIIFVGERKNEIEATEPLSQPFIHIDLYLTLLGKKYKEGKFRVLLGDVSELYGEDTHPLIVEARNKIDLIMADLLSLGFDVIRFPLVVELNGNTIDKIFSFNNCIVEIYKAADQVFRRVYLPDYGIQLKPYFDKAKAIIEKEDFTVKKVEGMQGSSHSHGSLHCLTKDLVRDFYP